MFSIEFGKVRNPSDVIGQDKNDFDDFLADKFVFLQNYTIDKKSNVFMENIQMFKVVKNIEHAINSEEISNPDLLKNKLKKIINRDADYLMREAIQYVCHLINRETK
jgi:hypothetical protein